MKRIITASLVTFASLVPTMSQGKTNETSSFTVKLSPLGLANNSYSGGIDMGVTDNISVGIDATYLSKLDAYTDDAEVDGTAYSVGVKSTLHGNGVTKDGPYASVGAHMVSAEAKVDGEKKSVNDGLGRLLVGYQTNSDMGLTLQLGAGVDKHFYKSKSGLHKDTVAPAFEFNMGYTL